MNDYSITNEYGYEKDYSYLNDVIERTLKHEKVKNATFSIVFVDNEKIQYLNKNYRNIDRITDVISFAFEEVDDIEYDGMRFLGEIYISYERCVSQAKDYGHSLKREFCYLAVHGLLHLLGYDHMVEEDKKVMRSLEEEILNEYDIKR